MMIRHGLAKPRRSPTAELVMSVDDCVEGLDVRTVSDWLLGSQLGAESPLTFSRLGRGQSNLTYLITDARAQQWVLRRPPLGALLDSAHDVVREHRILAALSSTAVPTPSVLGLCEDEHVSDVPILLMEYVDGVVLDGLTPAERLTDHQRHAVGLGMVTALGAVHSVDLGSTGLSTLSSHGPYAHRQLKRWYGQWERSHTRQRPEIDALHARLGAAAPAQGELTLVHGDFHLGNVIVAPQQGEVRAILDWELCTLGDPLADLGGLFAYWPEAGEPAGPGMDIATLPGFPTRTELAAAYQQRTRRSLVALGFWYVLALWKVAIIAEGVLRRTLDEPRNATAGPMVTSATVDDLVERAVEAADAHHL